MRISFLQVISRGLNFFRSLGWKVTYASYREKYSLHESFRFNGFHIQFYGEGRIEVGENSYIGELSTVQVARGRVVKIGSGCRISHNVRIYTHTAVADADFSQSHVPEKQGDVVIGDFCWVGANVFINPDLTIGTNSVVGANSVVTNNIPADEIWGGVPARLIRRKVYS